ncbi:hypothetical protein EV385_6734 [Krasilnikovia cinnamomea]|uniref:Uncharacterized protein n=1 Tax=Krasilnikovia cinnamomea TaxID=349313 RepID=A0A4Q7Z828_9ACTN|nr:hypothetical protein [Krasilnikovia cinnamomea]RZU46657.1 hypothetical protein EV385_6734 [Krasilnikovia cinnamomea]
MGTGGKTAHQAYDVTPTASGPGDGTGPSESAGQAAQIPAELQALTASLTDGGLDPADIAGFQAATPKVAAALEQYGDGSDELKAAIGDAHAQQLAWLQQLTPQQLQQLAAAQGFQHSELVGLSGKQPHPLVHWLDPFYPADITSKQKIQEVAQARYAALAAGETINGLTLADLTPPPAPEPGDGTWTASLADVVGLQAQIATTLADLPYAKWGMSVEQITAVDAGLAAIVDAENKLATASCPDDPQTLAVAQAAAAHSISQALNGKVKTGAIPQLREAAVASGMLTAEQAGVLGNKELIAAARRSTPQGEAGALLQTADERAGQVADRLQAAVAINDLIGGPLKPKDPASWDAAGTAKLAELAPLIGKGYQAEAAINLWHGQAGVPLQKLSTVGAADCATGFRQWAKTQPVGELRSVAAALGLENAGVGTRAQVQNYIAGQWDTAIDTAALQSAVTAKATAAKPTPAAGGAAPAAATPAVTGAATEPASTAAKPKPAGTAKAGGPVVAKSAGWVAQHANLVAALKHAAASSSGLPARQDDKVVAGWDFGKGTSGSHLGGTHSKSLHTGPDGKPWMFKSDSSGGARAAAESDAARVFAAAGLPAVPVYRATVAGKSGSVQPLVTQADHFPASPKSWGQADADAIVRYHVAAWAVSNHDGHAANLLRTPAGGMLAIDLGQAYKFCDSDKLSMSYNPVGSTITHTLYQAHQSGSLPKGVTVNPAAAHPVLAAIEKIPDSQWRAMLHDTAHTGAKKGVSWAPAMRQRAAKTHGIPADKVSTAQVAEAFLDAAVDRKKGLRQAFTTFFGGELKLPGASTLLKGGQ